MSMIIVPNKSKPTSPRLMLFPDTTRVETGGTGEALSIAGCELASLAEHYGTPLYLYDRATLDATVTTYQQTLAEYPAENGITFAGKAFLCTALAQWTQQHDLWLDCSSQGELAVASAAGVSRTHLLVHGVNKSLVDLQIALIQAGTLVIDNQHELEHLVMLAPQNTGPLPDLWLRYRPGVVVNTHTHTLTGQEASKFGMNRDEIYKATHICQTNDLPLKGLHFHLGSNFHNLEPVGIAVDQALELVKEINLGDQWILCPGGGCGVAYHEDEIRSMLHPTIESYTRFIVDHIVVGCKRLGLALPRLQLEPGRSLIARAGVALYRVGAIKHTSQRTWVLLDGGLADNPRPALYQARYTALPVSKPNRETTSRVWMGGPYCESGDVLIEDLPFPEVQPGELIAIPVSGAYQLSMASNYNGAYRPAVLWLEAGEAHLIQARENSWDLLHRDRPLPVIN